MSPEIPGRPDQHQNMDDKARSRTDSSQFQTKPEVSVDEQKIGKEKTALDRVNAEMEKYPPDSPGYKHLETRRNKLLQEQEPLGSGNENPQTNSTEDEKTDNETSKNLTDNNGINDDIYADMRNEYGGTGNQSESPSPSEQNYDDLASIYGSDGNRYGEGGTENENTDNETSKNLTDTNGINDDIYADMRNEYGGTGNQSESPSPSEQSYDDLASIYGSDGNDRYGDGNYGERGYDAGEDTSDTGGNA